MKSRVLTAFFFLVAIALLLPIVRVQATTNWDATIHVSDAWSGEHLNHIAHTIVDGLDHEVGEYPWSDGYSIYLALGPDGSNHTLEIYAVGYANYSGGFTMANQQYDAYYTLYPEGISTDWNLTSAEGVWDEWNRTSWHVWNQEDQQYGNMTYQRFINDFSGYHATINFSDFTMGKGAWWWLDSEKRFYFALQLQGSANFCLRFWVRFSEGTNTFGILRDRMVWAGAYANFSEHANIAYENIFNQPTNAEGTYFDTWTGMSNYLDFYVWKVDNNSVSYQINMVKSSESLPVKLAAGSVGGISSAWFTTVRVYEFFKHEGLGSIRGGMVDEFTSSGFSGETTDKRSIGFWQQLSHDLFSIASSVLPSWLTDYISQFASWGGYILGFLSIVWGIIMSVAPYLPFILLFWVLDAALTSVNQGSFTPLGTCIMTIYDWGTQLIHVLVAIGNAIYSFIKFW